MFSFFRKKVAKPLPLLVPRIKHLAFLDTLNSIPDMTQASMPVVVSVAGDLLLTLALNEAEQFVMVTPAVLDELQLDFEQACALALENGWQALDQLTVRTDGVLYEFTAPDNMVACSLLYPSIWDKVEQDLSAPVLAWFAHRELVLFTADRPDGLAALQEAAAELRFEDNHALSKLLFRRVEGQWQPLD